MRVELDIDNDSLKMTLQPHPLKPWPRTRKQTQRLVIECATTTRNIRYLQEVAAGVIKHNFEGKVQNG